MAEHNDIGRKGEELAVDYLLRHNYTVLEQNWRFGKAEIDILAQFNDTLAVVEVKTRSTDVFGNPESFVNKTKIDLLVKAVNAYCEQKEIDACIRFDIISVVLRKKEITIKHIENAFYHF